MASRQRPVSLPRVLGGTVLLVAIAETGVLAARSLPDTPLGWLGGIALGLVLTPILASPIEWLVHRYIYHRVLIRPLRPIYEVHHRAHHHIFFPTWRYVTGGPPRRLPIRGTDRSRVHTSAAGGF